MPDPLLPSDSERLRLELDILASELKAKRPAEPAPLSATTSPDGPDAPPAPDETAPPALTPPPPERPWHAMKQAPAVPQDLMLPFRFLHPSRKPDAMQNYLNLKPTSPWPLKAADQILCADIDGDGHSELVLFDPWNARLGVLASFSLGDLSPAWQDEPSRLISWGVWSQRIGPKQGPSWTFSDDDVLSAARFTGKDQAAQVVIRNTTTGALAVLQWTGAAFAVQTSVANELVPGVSLEAGDQLFFADMNDDGNDELILFRPSTLFLAAFAWTEAGFRSVFATQKVLITKPQNMWGLFNDSAFAWADFLGNGQTQLLIVNRAERTATAGFFGWDGTTGQYERLGYNMPVQFALTPQVVPIHLGSEGGAQVALLDPFGGTITLCRVQANVPALGLLWSTKNGVDGLSYGLGDTVHFADLDGDGQAEMIVVSRTTPEAPATISVFGWTGAAMTLRTQVQALDATTPWPLTGTDYLSFADLDGDGRAEMVAFHAAFPARIGLFAWAANAFDSGYATGPTERSVPGWSAETLGAAPAGYIPFTAGQQPAILKYITQQLVKSIEDMKSCTDIRETYTITSFDPQYDDWRNNVASLSCPAEFKTDQEDFAYVQQVLEGELYGLSKCSGFFSAADSHASFVKSVMQVALQTVVTNINDPVQQHIPEALTWVLEMSELFVRTMGALVGALESNEISEANFTTAENALALSAGTARYALSALKDRPSVPTRLSADQFAFLYEAYYQATLVGGGILQNTIRQSSIALELFGPLCDHPWSFTAQNVFSGYSATAARLLFYQRLMPIKFVVDRSSNSEEYNASIPAYAEWSQDGQYYLLSSGAFTTDIPSKTLMDDLTGPVGVRREDLFLRQNGWENLKLTVLQD